METKEHLSQIPNQRASRALLSVIGRRSHRRHHAPVADASATVRFTGIDRARKSPVPAAVIDFYPGSVSLGVV
jgi:hypothetical protein